MDVSRHAGHSSVQVTMERYLHPLEITSKKSFTVNELLDIGISNDEKAKMGQVDIQEGLDDISVEKLKMLLELAKSLK